MIGCYILFSKKLDRFYIGITQEGINERIIKHNNHEYGDHRFTAKASDWVEFLFVETGDFKKAVKIEKQIKKMKSSAYIHNLKKYPELLAKLQCS